MGIPRYAAVGLLEMLWHFTAEFALDGGIGKHDDATICEALHWNDDSTILIDALVDAKWLDRCKCHRLRVHDWPNHADQTVQRVLAKRKQAFAQCYDDPSSEVAPSKMPLPKASCLKPKANTEGSARAPVDHQNKYDGETENDAQKIVALIVATWDNWPQDQVEPSVMRLRAADPELTLDEWTAIIKEAHRTTRPGESATRLHTWLARQISIYKKDQTTGGKRETPQQRERREQLERAKQRCIDAEEKEENNGDGKVRVSGVADFLGRISPDGDDRRSTGTVDATPGRDK